MERRWAAFPRPGSRPRRPGPSPAKAPVRCCGQRWFGPHIHASTNGGKTWKLPEKGLELKCVPDQSIKRIWRLPAGHADESGVVYAGAVTRVNQLIACRCVAVPGPRPTPASAFSLVG